MFRSRCVHQSRFFFAKAINRSFVQLRRQLSLPVMIALSSAVAIKGYEFP
jgi:hypothetical protein